MIPIDLIPLETGPTPQIIAWWIGWFGMLIGAYVVFICEKSDKPLILYGVFSALLGVCVYSTVRLPDWLPELFDQHIMVTASLVLIFGMALHLTYLVWQYYALKPPWVRIAEIARSKADRLH